MRAKKANMVLQSSQMKIIVKRRVRLLLTFLVLLLAACTKDEPIAVPTPKATNTAVPHPSATLPPATATPTPEPTPILPAVAAADQPLTEDGLVTIASVSVPDAAWLVIHAQHKGQVGEVLGYAAVPPGSSSDLTITIDPLQATPRLVAMLHQDAGQSGDFEFPGPDDPWLENDEAVAAGFDVDIQVALPVIAVADQDVFDDGLVHVDSVYTPAPGWLLIHADEDGAVGPLIGHVFLRAGESEGVIVPIQWRDATPRLYAVLVEDDGRPGRLDYPQGDLPVIVNGQPLITPFNVTLPPDVYVLDQPVVDGKIVVERVISDGPGWLVVYFDENDLPARIIGSAPLDDGLNEMVEVDVIERAVTDKLHIVIHDDDDPVGRFNFPGGDNPRLYQGRLPASFTFLTNAGNYLVARDQALGEETAVTIPYVVTDKPVWLVIRTSAVPDAGDVLGAAWLPAGINRDVVVAIEAEQLPETLYAVLYLDAGEPEQFDFPDGADRPLEHNGRVIQSPFNLLEKEGNS